MALTQDPLPLIDTILPSSKEKRTAVMSCLERIKGHHHKNSLGTGGWFGALRFEVQKQPKAAICFLSKPVPRGIFVISSTLLYKKSPPPFLSKPLKRIVPLSPLHQSSQKAKSSLLDSHFRNSIVRAYLVRVEEEKNVSIEELVENLCFCDDLRLAVFVTIRVGLGVNL